VSTSVESVEHIATNSTVNDNVNVNVLHKDNVEVETIDFDGLLVLINETFKRSFRTINTKNRQAYNARMKQGYKKEDIRTAILNCKTNQYHIDTNYRFCTPEFFSRADILDKYSAVTIEKKAPKQNAKSVPCWNR
jgi:uncharacterized phage protein (TIGR02220 family)